ncbi:type II toxin-antitoxin system RelE/ParE family toxin [Nostoc sp. UHCC 0702]|nr:type II toxin-antitoxin system RelE/ParE family toxin [Nostoc sp. UHCC 0702]
MEYFIAKEASEDLNEILDYFLVRNINAGERFIRRFNNKCQNIAQFPNIGQSSAQFDPRLRGIPLDGYIIFGVAESEYEMPKLRLFFFVPLRLCGFA